MASTSESASNLPKEGENDGTEEPKLEAKPKDRIDEIIDALATDKPLPGGKFRYTEGWDLDNLEQELKKHPFFMTEMPKPGEPIPPLIEALQQLKYSADDNSPNELAANYKEDGLFHFKIKKYRIATTCFSEGIRAAENPQNPDPDETLVAQLYNNRAAAQFYLQNYRSAMQDCEKALRLKPDYAKPLTRALECAMKLEKWDTVIELCDLGDKVTPNNPDIHKTRLAAKRKKRLAEVESRKSTLENKERALELSALLNTVKATGIKIINESFLQESVAESGKRVKIENGKLVWPLLFYYPQFSQSDFIEGFHQDSRFIDHLTEILDKDRPAWDRENEYHSDTVDLYFIDTSCGGYVKVDLQSTLHDVFKHKRYYLPTNGVPGFFVMARDSEMCKVLLERCQ